MVGLVRQRRARACADSGRLRRVLVAVAVLAFVGSVGLAAAVPAGHELVVADAATGDRLTSVTVDQGTTVTLSYTHSVERTPVHDVYVVRGTRLDNVEMRFQSYGWGLPASADVHREDGAFVFDPDRQYDELFVSPGSIANHRLTISEMDSPTDNGAATDPSTPTATATSTTATATASTESGTTIDLVALSGEQTVRITIERRSALDALLS